VPKSASLSRSILLTHVRARCRSRRSDRARWRLPAAMATEPIETRMRTQRAAAAVGRPVSPGLVASFVAALSVLWLALASAPALAGCGDRPGTPVNMTATLSNNQIQLNFTNTASEAPIYWDIEVTDGAGHYLDGNVAGVQGTRTQATGGQYSEMGRFQLTPIQGGNFHWGIQYCFRVRARTQAGTQGCVSKLWNAPVCVTTPTDDVNQYCTTYARDAVNQFNYLRGVKYRGDCGDEGERWSNDWLAHYNWCVEVRGNPQTAGAPDFEREERNKRLRVCSNYECLNSVCKQVIPEKPIKSTGKPKTTTTTPAPAPPEQGNQCNYSVLITNDECINGDGTPMTSDPAGELKTYGCGASEDEALEHAKAEFYALQGPALTDEDSPCPGCCTYKKTVTKGCVCAARAYQSYKVEAQPCMRGMVRTAVGACRCPVGTRWIGMRCRRVSAPSAPAHVPPPEPSRSRPSPDMTTVSTCPSRRPVGTWPHCCPLGTVFTGHLCRRLHGSGSGPGTGGANGIHPNTGGTGTCPPSRPVGTPPNCCPRGTVFTGHLCRRLHGSGSGPGTGGTNGTKPNPGGTCPRSRPVGTPPNCCPQGTVFTGHLCRRLHGSGSSGNGGTNGTKPSTGGTTTPKTTTGKCTGGRHGVPPNCFCSGGRRFIGGHCRVIRTPTPSNNNGGVIVK
jgi:hypothetical protein